MEFLKLILFMICYLLLYVAYPYLCVGYLFRGRKPWYVFFASLAVGNISVIGIVYILYLFNIYNLVTLIVSLLAFGVLSQLLGGSKRRMELSTKFKISKALVQNHQFRWRTAYYNLGISGIFHGKRLSKEELFLKVLLGISLIACFGYGFYTRLFSAFSTSYFGAADMYTLLESLRGMENGELFYMGVSPFGLQNTMIAFNTLFPFGLVSVVHFWGAVSFALQVAGFSFLGCKMFRSGYSVLISLWILLVSDFFAYFRFIDYGSVYSMPQNYVIAFVIPSALFFLSFLREKKRPDLVISAVFLALTILISYYAAIYVLLGILLVYLICFKSVEKIVLVKTLMVFILALCISMAPLLGGVLKGIPLDPSINKEIGLDLKGVSDNNANFSANLLWMFEYEFYENLFPTKINEEIAFKEQIERGKYLNQIIGDNFSTPKIDLHVNLLRERMYAGMTIVSLLAAICLIYYNYRRKNLERAQYQLWASGFCVLLFILLLCYGFGFPEFIIADRQRIFLRFLIPILIGFIPELIIVALTIEKTMDKFKTKPYVAFILIMTAILMIDSFILGFAHPKTPALQLEYSSAAKAVEMIKSDHKDGNFTLISSYIDSSLVMNQGFHYELSGFLKEIEKEDVRKGIYIPTRYVYLLAEKTVLPIYQVMDFSYPENIVTGEPISKGAVNLPLPDASNIDTFHKGEFYYLNSHNRNAVMSKAYYWAESYTKYYPDEMTVFYEDLDIIVYRLKQDQYALNNLLLPFARTEL